jgi:hypothetical protein
LRLPLPFGRFVVAATAAVVTLVVAPGSAAWAVNPALAGPPRSENALAAAHRSALALSQDALRLTGALSASFPSTFGGLTIGTQGFTVYTTKTHTGIASVVDQYLPKGTVLYALSAHTLGALDSIERSLEQNWLTYQGRGIDIVAWGPDVPASTVVLQVVGPTSDQTAWLESLYPRGTLTVQPVGLAPLPSGFVARVASEPHAQLPRGLAPFLGAVAMFAIVSTALAIVLLRRRHARAARADAVVPLTLVLTEAPCTGADEPVLAAASA